MLNKLSSLAIISADPNVLQKGKLTDCGVHYEFHLGIILEMNYHYFLFFFQKLVDKAEEAHKKHEYNKELKVSSHVF